MTAASGIARAGFVCIGVLLLCLRACYSNTDVPRESLPGETRSLTFSRQSPDDLLQFYTTAHELKDIEMYIQALHRDYRYWIVPDTESGLEEMLGMPWMTRAKDIQATETMFGDPIVKAIHMRFFPITDWEACTVTLGADSAGAQSVRGFEITVDPLIHLEIPTYSGGTYLKEISRTTMRMTVVPDPELPGSWVILAIREKWETD